MHARASLPELERRRTGYQDAMINLRKLDAANLLGARRLSGGACLVLINTSAMLMTMGAHLSLAAFRPGVMSFFAAFGLALVVAAILANATAAVVASALRTHPHPRHSTAIAPALGGTARLRNGASADNLGNSLCPGKPLKIRWPLCHRPPAHCRARYRLQTSRCCSYALE